MGINSDKGESGERRRQQQSFHRQCLDSTHETKTKENEIKLGKSTAAATSTVAAEIGSTYYFTVSFLKKS